MFIREIIIDGFKSYATRTVISGFDKYFNAITGLNGSGKSNILDSICFVLGIRNLSQVRASSLQELVYKQGQAGVTKASVTLVFDNSDPKQSPLGYQDMTTITVTRQIAIGGRNKYLINGHVAQAQRVQTLFHSVQLNVDNPHFLIMQGRITKVLNMRPIEILGMVEEAAGTRMYEARKQAALRTIEKKDAKVQEINHILSKEITPTIEKLRNDQTAYLEYTAASEEIATLERFVVAHQYHTASQAATARAEAAEQATGDAKAKETEAADLKEQLAESQREVEELRATATAEATGDHKKAADEAGQLAKLLVQADTRAGNRRAAASKDEVSLQQAVCALKSARDAAETAQAAEEAAVGADEQARKQYEDAGAAVEEAHGELRAAAAGMAAGSGRGRGKGKGRGSGGAASGAGSDSMTDVDGDEEEEETGGTVQDRLMRAKARASSSRAESKAAMMRAKAARQREGSLKKEAGKAAKAVAKLEAALQTKQSAADAARATVNALTFEPTEAARIIASRDEAKGRAAALSEEAERVGAQVQARVQVTYDRAAVARGAGRRPADGDGVHGVVAQLVRVSDGKHSNAIEMAAGGRLFNVVVEDEKVGGALLSKGKLRRRITVIPLSKIRRGTLSASRVERAREITGGRANPAIELVAFGDEVRPAMEHVFGQHLICEDAAAARRAAFDKGVQAKAVTLEGDVFDPSGVLEGGSRPSSGGVLEQLAALAEVEQRRDAALAELKDAQGAAQEAERARAEHSKATANAEVAEHALSLARAQAEATEAGAAHKALVDAGKEAEEQERVAAERTRAADEAEAEAAQLAEEAKDVEAYRARAVEAAEGLLSSSKEGLARAEEAAKKAAERLETARGELQAARDEVTACDKAVVAAEEAKAASAGKAEEEAAAAETLRLRHDEAAERLGEFEAALDGVRQALQGKEEARRELARREGDAKAECKRLSALAASCRKEAGGAKARMAALDRKHEWIAGQKQFFGDPTTTFDFESRSPEEAARRLSSLQQRSKTLERSVNKKVMGLIDSVTSKYHELKSKREVIVGDRSKIEKAIAELDAKKAEALEKTWAKVNGDFRSIFATLLPGASAKLDPVDGEVLKGLDVRVAFGGVWKEGLSELSGGQRSLLALSLILSLLLFKPAPMYILDEVDAALDLSHTQNIGRMLKAHFAHSQFIVVSLKQGMFSNANVIFRTKFVDGVSTVTRTVGRPQLAGAGAGAARGGGGGPAAKGGAGAGGRKRARLDKAAADAGAEDGATAGEATAAGHGGGV